MIRSDWRWWRSLSCWWQLKVLWRPVAFDPRKTAEPWENEHARVLRAELDRRSVGPAGEGK